MKQQKSHIEHDLLMERKAHLILKMNAMLAIGVEDGLEAIASELSEIVMRETNKNYLKNEKKTKCGGEYCSSQRKRSPSKELGHRDGSQ